MSGQDGCRDAQRSGSWKTPGLFTAPWGLDHSWLIYSSEHSLKHRLCLQAQVSLCEKEFLPRHPYTPGAERAGLAWEHLARGL